MKTYYLHVKTNKFDNDTVNIQYTLGVLKYSACCMK